MHSLGGSGCSLLQPSTSCTGVCLAITMLQYYICLGIVLTVILVLGLGLGFGIILYFVIGTWSNGPPAVSPCSRDRMWSGQLTLPLAKGCTAECCGVHWGGFGVSWCKVSQVQPSFTKEEILFCLLLQGMRSEAHWSGVHSQPSRSTTVHVGCTRTRDLWKVCASRVQSKHTTV